MDRKEVTVLHKSWIIMDLINLLALTQIDSLQDEYPQLISNMDSEIIDGFKEISKRIDKSNFALKLLFSKRFIAEGITFDIQDVYRMEKVDDLINYFETIDTNKIKRKFISSIDNSRKSNSTITLDNILENSALLIEYFAELDYDELTQWEYCKFMNNPTSYFNEIARILEEILSIYTEFISRYTTLIDNVCDDFSERINREGKKALNILETLISLENYNKVFIVPTLLNLNISVYPVDNQVYINLGKDFELTLNFLQGDKDIEESIKSINAITDDLKFKIINCILTKDSYGKEICDATGLSKSSLTYHMEYLVSRNIVNMRKQGNRIYYSLNKKEVINSLQSMLKYFV